MRGGKALKMAVLLGAMALAWSPASAETTPPASPEDAALRARYALPTSRFVTLNGEPVHLVDEGHGPAIVLLHGSFSSLRQWDGWAAALKDRYRVIRLDMPPAGLSGPSPEADYTVERRLEILEALRKRLGLERFLLLGTSSAGITAAAYAAAYPQRLTGLIYSNALVSSATFDRSAFPESLIRALEEDAQHRGYHTETYWREILLFNVEDKSKVTPELVRQWTELNNRALKMPPLAPGKTAASHARTANDLTRVTTPTLFLWSENDHEATVDREAKPGLALLAAKDKQLIVIPRCGHMTSIDCDERGLAAALPFINRVTKAAR